MKTACMLSVWIASSLPAWAAETSVPPREARSVHLGYQAPDAMLFYNEMMVLESTPGSYLWRPAGTRAISEFRNCRTVAK